MTEHIVNFAIGIEDDKIIRLVEESAKNQIIDDLKKKVINAMFESRYRSFSTVDDALSEMSKEIITDAFNENKEAIIDKAAKYLAEKMIKTKAVQEKIKEVTE